MENDNGGGVRKGAWTKEEDILLRDCIHKFGEGKWHLVPLRAGLKRCRKSCRLRWLNYLRPNLNRGFFSKDEVDLIVRLHKLLGNRWSLIAGRLPGRTANDVKNFWNTHILKKSPPAGENGRGKIITKSNIVRPRPRTFSNSQPPPWSSELLTGSHSSSSSIRPRTNDVTVVDEAPAKSRVPSSSTSLSTGAEANDRTVSDEPRGSLQEDLDECMRWWGNLVEMTENGEQTPLLFSDDAPPVTAFPAGFGEDGGCSSADGEGLYGNLTLDGDVVWNLNNSWTND